MKGPGSVTIKLHSPSQAPRGRGNPTPKQKPHNHKQSTADTPALQSHTEATDPPQLTYKQLTTEYKIRHETPTPNNMLSLTILSLNKTNVCPVNPSSSRKQVRVTNTPLHPTFI